MNSGARARRTLATSDMAYIPATGGDATDYDVSTRDGLAKSVPLDQKLSRGPK